MSTCGVLIDFECPACGNTESLTEPQMKTFFNDLTSHLHPSEAVKAVFELQHVIALKTCNNDECKSDMNVISARFATPAPWIVPIRLSSIRFGLTFGLNQLAMLPLTVIHDGFTYILAGITFLKDAHFEAILGVPGGFIHYDGTATNPPAVTSFNEAVDSMAAIGALIQTIYYFKTPKPKKRVKA